MQFSFRLRTLFFFFFSIILELGVVFLHRGYSLYILSPTDRVSDNQLRKTRLDTVAEMLFKKKKKKKYISWNKFNYREILFPFLVAMNSFLFMFVAV